MGDSCDRESMQKPMILGWIYTLIPSVGVKCKFVVCLDCPGCAERPLCKLEAGPVLDVISNLAVIHCCSICLPWIVALCGWRLMIPLPSQIWGKASARTCWFAAVGLLVGSHAAALYPGKVVLQQPWADLHHWQQRWHSDKKLQILVLRVFWNVKVVSPSSWRGLMPWDGREGIWAKSGHLFLECLNFLFPFYSEYSQFPGLSSIPCLWGVLEFFPLLLCLHPFCIFSV